MKWISLTAPIGALTLALMVPPAAAAAGGPVSPVQGTSIGWPGSPYRYSALNAQGDTTVEVQRSGAGPARSGLRLSGRYGIPGVDYNGSTTGLSADGRTLVLAELPGNRQPRVTRLVVLDTPRLAIRTRIVLPGWSTVDAISPDGRWLYLIHYPSSDISRYEVRAYDLVAGRLLPKPIIDPHDRGEAMTGFPVSRVMSSGGRWAYTLYLRPSGVPFVHALDTAGLKAVCVDLPSLGNANVGNGHIGLGPGGRRLAVDVDGVTRAFIDTRTFKVSPRVDHESFAPARPATHERRPARSQGRVPWELIVLSIAALGLIGAVGAGVARSRRRAAHGRGPREAAVIHVDARHPDRDPADDEVPVA